jgi:hypothetical protein
MMTNTTTAAVAKLAKSIARSARFEDRLEYSYEDLARMYALSFEDAKAVHAELHRIARDGK